MRDSRDSEHLSMVGQSGVPSAGGGSPVSEFGPGAIFANRYTVLEPIGHGGMGSVYLAKDGNTGEAVAIKLVRAEYVSTPSAIERFLLEGKVARRLAHPGIARVFDIDHFEDRWFITMEFVQGPTLRRWMNEKQSAGSGIPVEDALWATRQILSVVQYIHDQKLVHRDLKPENLIVCKERGSGDSALKLVDFGLARRLEIDQPGLTQTGNVVGTLAYMSPEQRAGKPVDHRSDLYSVGVILYEMLTGVSYDGNWELGRHVPDNFHPVLESVLSKFPDDRPADAAEFLEMLDDEELEEEQGGRTGQQRPRTIVYENAVADERRKIRKEVEALLVEKNLQPPPSWKRFPPPGQPHWGELYSKIALYSAILNLCFCFLGIPSIVCIISGHLAVYHGKSEGQKITGWVALIEGYLSAAAIGFYVLARFNVI